MSDIKVISWHDQPYGDYQLGFCTVEMASKCRFILKVVKSKSGNIYCSFTSVKLGDYWQASFSFTDKETEKRFFSTCLEQLKPMMEPKEEQQQEADPFCDDEAPF